VIASEKVDSQSQALRSTARAMQNVNNSTHTPAAVLSHVYTVAEKWTVAVVSPFCVTVSLFCDSVDRSLEPISITTARCVALRGER